MSVDRAIWWWLAGEPGFYYGRLMSWWGTGELMESGGGVEWTRWNELDSHTQRLTLDTREERKHLDITWTVINRSLCDIDGFTRLFKWSCKQHNAICFIIYAQYPVLFITAILLIRFLLFFYINACVKNLKESKCCLAACSALMHNEKKDIIILHIL